MGEIARELVTLLAVLAVAWVTASQLAKTAFFKSLPELSSLARFTTIDGLRGFLALAVFVHHAQVHHYFLETGSWVAPRSAVFGNAGPVPVQLFFIITGFLFWGQAIHNGAKIKLRNLAISRVARIAPLYLVTMVVTFGFAAVTVGGRLNMEAYDVTNTLIRLLTFGGLNVNMLGDVDLMPINANVSWTLVYEWGFYVALPLLAWFATPKRFPLIAVAMLLLTSVYGIVEVQNSYFFLLGMAAAHIKDALPEFEPAKSKVASWTVVGLLLTAFVQRGHDTLFLGAAVLFPAFLLIVYGNTLFGLLRTPGTLVLGACSYSIYLVHGIFLFVFLDLVLGQKLVLSMLPPLYWIVICGAAGLLVSLCSLTFRWIEHPAIEAGKRLRRPALPAVEPKT